jgi:hypothetical protein
MPDKLSFGLFAASPTNNRPKARDSPGHVERKIRKPTIVYATHSQMHKEQEVQLGPECSLNPH